MVKKIENEIVSFISIEKLSVYFGEGEGENVKVNLIREFFIEE